MYHRKDCGGLGVKNLELFNLSLQSKWKWRCLTEKNVVWNKLLSCRYGDLNSLAAILTGMVVMLQCGAGFYVV